MDPHHGQLENQYDEQGDIHSLGFSDREPSEDFVRSSELVKIVDGDTLRLRIDLGWSASIVEDVRLAGVNTPENRGPERSAGLWVTEQVKRWFYDAGVGPVLIRSKLFKLGKWGRCICEVWHAGKSLNRWLIEQSYGWQADEHGTLTVPRDIGLINVPEEIKRQVRQSQ